MNGLSFRPGFDKLDIFGLIDDEINGKKQSRKIVLYLFMH